MALRSCVSNADAQYCRDITKREAKNFYWGFIALPKEQRLAIYALYGFARQVDDAVDLPPAQAAVNGTGADPFHSHRGRLDDCFAGRGDDPIIRVLSQVVRDYGIPREDLEALVTGVEMDLSNKRYEAWDDLRVYCWHVAGAVGRMCVRVFGYTDPTALDFAADLGIAMQLANILRDVRDDVELGRIYLPKDDLQQFGVTEHGLQTGDPGAGWEGLIHHEIERASTLFASGLRVTRAVPRRASACVLTMAGIYQAIIEEIERDPYLPLKRRASLDSKQKLSVMLKSWLQAV